MRPTPAALAALEKGDMDNFLTAATPGGIEAQEAAGQAMLCAAAQIPKEIHGATREQLEALGFKFGTDVDELFVSCTLPPGWKKQATSHSMHSDLLDDKGRKRAGIFYKAAFYDRRADLSMTRRYSIDRYRACDAEGNPVEERHDTRPTHFQTAVMDGNTPIYVVGFRAESNYELGREHSEVGEAWLSERSPQWKEAMAYWD